MVIVTDGIDYRNESEFRRDRSSVHDIGRGGHAVSNFAARQPLYATSSTSSRRCLGFRVRATTGLRSSSVQG